LVDGVILMYKTVGSATGEVTPSSSKKSNQLLMILKAPWQSTSPMRKVSCNFQLFLQTLRCLSAIAVSNIEMPMDRQGGCQSKARQRQSKSYRSLETKV
jgi:hypothetical protein